MSVHSFEDFLEVHEGQLLSSRVPQHFWPTLYDKLKNQDLDAGECFQIIVKENEEGSTKNCSVIAIADLDADDAKNIFLIDHAWTFRLNEARAALQEVDSLRENLAVLLGIDANNRNISSADNSDIDEDILNTSSSSREKNYEILSAKNDRIIDSILDEMWRFVQTYTIRVQRSTTDESDLPVWYLPDEFGIRIGHSFTPNCRMIPFFFVFDKMAYSLLFPINEIAYQDEVTRNYLDNALFYANPEWRSYLMHPWEPNEFVTGDFIKYSAKSDDYFLSGRVADKLPESSLTNFNAKSENQSNGVYSAKIFSTDFQLINKLCNINLEPTDDLYSADIIWLREHFYDFKRLAERNPGALINQFPFESVLTVKDLFAATVQSSYIKDGKTFYDPTTLELEPKWLPTTFNLNLELPEFVKYFKLRRQKGLENTWIVKPWNLARGLGIFVTKNLNCIIRLAESKAMIVCKYINNPVLFCRPDNGNMVKFDLRFIVFFNCASPLQISVYNKFWTRFAVNEYNLEKLDDILTHFTVHNYNANVEVLNLKCAEFVEQFEQFYPHLKWHTIQVKINDVIKEVFKAITSNKPPQGISPNQQSRAMYGFDLMLYWKDDLKTDVGVSFIEANFMPDCERACNFYPDFADTVFETLFFGKKSSKVNLL